MTQGALPGTVREEAERVLRSRRNILVSGGTGSGKTTLLNALIELLPEDERIVAIERSNCVRFEARGLQEGAVTIRDLVRHALRHRPDHIVVGEVRGGEAASDTGFMARLLMLCSLPRTNPGRQLQHKRVNGPYTLIMTAVGQIGLPFGNLSRLLLAWVCTEAVRTQSRELILGSSISGFMRKLSINSDSGGDRSERTRLRNQMRRLFSAHVRLVYEHGEASVNSPIASPACRGYGTVRSNWARSSSTRSSATPCRWT